MTARRRVSSAGDSTGKSPEAFRTISEVAEALGVPQHVLRFWETRFSQVRPLKRAGGRRYYRPEDIALIRRIRDLLYDEGYSIRGVQKLLKSAGARGLVEKSAPARPPADGVNEPSAGGQSELQSVLDELTELRDLLR